jgi:hypothetical protein
MQEFDIDRRALNRHKSAPLNWQGGKWWQAACQLARKNKRAELLGY